MQVTFDGRPLVAREVGRLVTFTDLDEDWASLGWTLKLRIKNNGSACTDYALTAVADPNSALLTTVAGCFPRGQGYECQIVSFLAGVEQTSSEIFTIDVKKTNASA